MDALTTTRFGRIPAGRRVWLTDKQAGKRGHKILPVASREAGKAPEKGRKAYDVQVPAGFKEGETVYVEGTLDAPLKALFGIAGAGPKAPPATMGGEQISQADFDRAVAEAFEQGFGEGRDTGRAERAESDELASRYAEDPESLTAGELRSYAERVGVELPATRMSKTAIVEAIDAASGGSGEPGEQGGG